MQEKKVKQGISSRIREARRALGLTQAELADRVGSAQSAISKIENGDQSPDISLLTALHEIFEIDINSILSDKKPTTVNVLDPDPEIAQLMEGARRVLTSGNPVAFDALERNIRYFDHAIAAEKRADASDKRAEAAERQISEMKSAVDELRKEMEELKRQRGQDGEQCGEDQSSGEQAA